MNPGLLFCVDILMAAIEYIDFQGSMLDYKMINEQEYEDIPILDLQNTLAAVKITGDEGDPDTKATAAVEKPTEEPVKKDEEPAKKEEETKEEETKE